jgi:hypothetical protein
MHIGISQIIGTRRFIFIAILLTFDFPFFLASKWQKQSRLKAKDERLKRPEQPRPHLLALHLPLQVREKGLFTGLSCLLPVVGSQD